MPRSNTYTVWYLDGDTSDTFETSDGTIIDLETSNMYDTAISRLSEYATGQDLVEGELERQGYVLPSDFEKLYDLPAPDVVSHLEDLELEGICYAVEKKHFSQPMGF